jgi:hypothetical protein
MITGNFLTNNFSVGSMYSSAVNILLIVYLRFKYGLADSEHLALEGLQI